MKNGDKASLVVFQNPIAFFVLHKEFDHYQLIMVNNGELIDSLPVQDETIYLRTRASNKTKFATFEHSIDNTNFTQLGNALYMEFNLKVFSGNKFCLFNYATKETGGFIDFDWFRVE